MIEVIVNGKKIQLDGEIRISELLKDGYVEMLDYVTVQVNDVIIPRTEYDNKMVKSNDAVEFLYYMGGGSQIFSIE